MSTFIKNYTTKTLEECYEDYHGEKCENIFSWVSGFFDGTHDCSAYASWIDDCRLKRIQFYLDNKDYSYIPMINITLSLADKDLAVKLFFLSMYKYRANITFLDACYSDAWFKTFHHVFKYDVSTKPGFFDNVNVYDLAIDHKHISKYALNWANKNDFDERRHGFWVVKHTSNFTFSSVDMAIQAFVYAWEKDRIESEELIAFCERYLPSSVLPHVIDHIFIKLFEQANYYSTFILYLSPYFKEVDYVLWWWVQALDDIFDTGFNLSYPSLSGIFKKLPLWIEKFHQGELSHLYDHDGFFKVSYVQKKVSLRLMYDYCVRFYPEIC